MIRLYFNKKSSSRPLPDYWISDLLYFAQRAYTPDVDYSWVKTREIQTYLRPISYGCVPVSMWSFSRLSAYK